VTAEQLQKKRYCVLEADSGPAALWLLRAGARFDLPISDVALPCGMNGCEVAGAVRARCADMRVIVVTGYAPGVALADMEVIRKRFQPEVLAEHVRANFAD
jgi:CheY-like chemotaxis protein